MKGVCFLLQILMALNVAIGSISAELGAEQPSQKDAAGQSHDPGVHGRGKAKDQWNQESIDHGQNAEKNQPPATSATSPKTRGKTRPRESRVEQHEHNENMDVSPEKQLAILNEMENEIVRMRESINLAVCHIMPDVKKLMARVKLAENALNNLKMFAEDAKNLPTLLRTLQAGTNRLQSLEEQYQDARASSSVLRSPFLPPRHNE